jgi:hypothetical protein
MAEALSSSTSTRSIALAGIELMSVEPGTPDAEAPFT